MNCAANKIEIKVHVYIICNGRLQGMYVSFLSIFVWTVTVKDS